MNRMIAGPDDWKGAGLPPNGQPKALYSGAHRHSKRVRLLRRAVPAALVLALLGLVAANYLNPERWLRIPTEYGTLVISGSKITMEAPRLAGFTRDQREYSVTAEAASQDTRTPQFVELRKISGHIDMQDNSRVSLTAVEGTYDSKGDLLTLKQEIIISSSAGYHGHLSEAKVEVKNGRIVSDKPVKMKMPQGTLEANRMEVTETGGVISFEGGVVLHLNADALNRGLPPAGPQAQAGQ
jgi:lipopolysaccharide export system protein LptC